MVAMLVKRFIKESENIASTRVRQSYAILCSIIGICLNVGLFIMKMIAGFISHSITISADGFNNLADAGTTLAAIWGLKMSSYGAGKNHPFGHGRIEWIVGLFTSLSVLFMGLELVRTSIAKIVHPTSSVFNGTIFMILIVSIGVKFYMFAYNRKVGKKINSMTLQITANDCISDCISTAAVLFSAIMMKLFNWKIDGWCGMAVSLFIIYAAYKSLGDVLGRIMGKAPDKELLVKIEEIINSHTVILKYYDMLVHDYGFGRFIISLRVAGDKKDAIALIAATEKISYEVYKTLDCECMIQPEFLVKEEEKNKIILQAIRNSLEKWASENIEVHNFRMTQVTSEIYVMFDLVVPLTLQSQEKEICKEIEAAIHAVNETYYIMINQKIKHRERAMWRKNKLKSQN